MSTGSLPSLPDPFQLGDEDSALSSPVPAPSPSLHPIQPIEPLHPSLRHHSGPTSAAESEVALDTTSSDSDGAQPSSPLDFGLPSKPPTPPSKSPAPGFVPAPHPPVVDEDSALGIDVPALCSPGLFLPIPDVSSLEYIFYWETAGTDCFAYN